MRAFACSCAVVFFAASAWAQVELVDPDAPTVRAKKVTPKKQPTDTADDSVDDTTDGSPAEIEPDEAPVERKPAAKVAPVAAPVAPKTTERKEAPKPTPAPLVVTPMTDAQLDDSWRAWREASASNDVKREQSARAELIKVKRRIGATNLEAWAEGLLRFSATREAAGDSGAAVEMAMTAIELAPDLPAAWSGLASAYFAADPSEIGRYLSAFKTAFTLQLRDPRYSRPMLADIATTLLLALIGTAIAVVLVLVVKRGYYFLYDFHFLFPRAAARWQTGALAVILLTVPVVFRFGVVPCLLVLFAAVTLYLTTVERVVAALLIGALGLIPMAGGAITKATAFAGTRAEQLYVLERGGSGTEVLAHTLETLAAEDKASFAELSVLGRYEIRRGRIEAATGHLKKALTIRSTDVSARVNLGVALMLTGDLENPKALFTNAKTDAPNLAAAPYNLGRLYQRRFQSYGERSAGEADNATGEFFEAHRRDASIEVQTELPQGMTPIEGNEYLMTVPLPNDELMALAELGDAPRRVTSQLTQLILGDAPEGIAPFYPAALAALVVLMGVVLARPLEASRSCSKCGRPVSHRGDPDVSPGSQMCTQCVNVFAKKNVVATSQKVRKQLEVARYQSRLERISYVFGLLFSGMGHVFAGWPVRGALYGFLFLAALLGFIVRHGLLRAPYEALPLVLRVAPLAVIFVAVYALSLHELRKRH